MCVEIFQGILDLFQAIFAAIVTVLSAILNAIVFVFMGIFNFLTCGGCRRTSTVGTTTGPAMSGPTTGAAMV